MGVKKEFNQDTYNTIFDRIKGGASIREACEGTDISASTYGRWKAGLESDGAENVPISTTELKFSLDDFNEDLMSYTVTTDPDIGSGILSIRRSIKLMVINAHPSRQLNIRNLSSTGPRDSFI